MALFSSGVPLQGGGVGLQILLAASSSSIVIRAANLVVGVGFPVFRSFKAIEEGSQADRNRCLAYWSAHQAAPAALPACALAPAYTALFPSHAPFPPRLPFYQHIKLLLLLWLSHQAAPAALAAAALHLLLPPSHGNQPHSSLSSVLSLLRRLKTGGHTASRQCVPAPRLAALMSMEGSNQRSPELQEPRGSLFRVGATWIRAGGTVVTGPAMLPSLPCCRASRCAVARPRPPCLMVGPWCHDVTSSSSHVQLPSAAPRKHELPRFTCVDLCSVGSSTHA
ncbi:unnamed protein product [Closterium sp. Naga37s-1]|nr:unnamed protein product [Closterium sp. Naga37s-1]